MSVTICFATVDAAFNQLAEFIRIILRLFYFTFMTQMWS